MKKYLNSSVSSDGFRNTGVAPISNKSKPAHTTGIGTMKTAVMMS